MTDESIRGAPATEPLAPVVAPVVETPVLQGMEFGRVTTGAPLMFGTAVREAAFGLVGLTEPGIGDWVEGPWVAVPLIVPAPAVPGAVVVLGAGTAGATPGGADPGLSDGAVAPPVGPLDTPDDPPVPDDPPAPDDPPLVCACAERPSAAMNPAASASFRDICDIAFSHEGFLNTFRTCWHIHLFRSSGRSGSHVL